MNLSERAVVCWLLLWSCCGCAGLDGDGRILDPEGRPRLLHRHREDREGKAAASQGSVTVGGLVEHPQVVEIGEAGLTLGQVLAQAGRQLGHAGDESMYVSLSRNVLGLQSIYHFPLRTVEQDYAGEIPMQAEDVIRLQDDVSLGLELPAPGFGPDSRISVAALGEQPRSVGLPDGRVGLFVGELGVLGLDPVREGATFVLITRPSSGGLVLNHFLLSVGQDPRVLTYPIHPHDQIVLTQLPRIPLVQQGLVERVRRSQESLSERPERPKIGERWQAATERRASGFATIRKGMAGVVQRVGLATIGRLF